MMSDKVDRQNWQVYLVECADGSLYTGITNDLLARLRAHNQGEGAKYTRSRHPVKLVYTENYPDRSSASKREWEIKQLKREEKEELISAN